MSLVTLGGVLVVAVVIGVIVSRRMRDAVR
jgi:hypothetical protein